MQSRDRETPLLTAPVVLGERGEGFFDGVPRALIVSDVRLYREAIAW
jgi:hypothetical protein